MRLRSVSFCFATAVAVQLAACASSSNPDLMQASVDGNVAALTEELDEGADIDIRYNRQDTPLTVATLFGRTEAVRLLLDRGANIDAQNEDGFSALHIAAYFGRPDIVRLLLERGANTELRSARGQTPLEAVSGPWTPELEEIYVNYGDALGLELDLKALERMRPEIQQILSEAQ